MQEIKCKILHLSDLHYGEVRNDISSYFLDEIKEDVDPAYRTTVQEITIDLMEELIKKEKKYDGICITGDFTFCGDESGFKNIEKDLIGRLNKLCSNSQAICCVPGNHDVKWFLNSTDPNLLSIKFLLYKNFIDKNKLTSCLIPKGNLIKGFLSFEKDNDPIYLDEERKLAILCINSAIRCGEQNIKLLQSIEKPTLEAKEALELLRPLIKDSETSYADEYNKIKQRLILLKKVVKPLSIFDIAHVTQIQRKILKDKIDDTRNKIGLENWDNYIKIAILHHHISTFDSQITEHKAFEMCGDSSEILRFLSDQQFDLVLTGHKHQPYFISRTFNERNIFLVGGSTIAGHPTRGEKQGFQSIEICKKVNKVSVSVTKLPVNKEITNAEKYLTDTNSQIDYKEINSKYENVNCSSPIFQFREVERPYEQLIKARKAKIFALTFRTLGDSFSSLKTNVLFENLEKIELYIYSLQTLFTNHPILKIEPHIEREWITSLKVTLNGFLNKDYFPNLQHVEVIVLSNIPILTGAIIELVTEDSQSGEIIKYTPIVKGISPAEIPTLVHKKINNNETQLYNAYKKLIENVGGPYYNLRYVIRKGEINRPNIGSFIQHLMSVCNNPLYKIKDRKYSVEVMLERLEKQENAIISPMFFANTISNQFKDGGLEIENHNAEIISFRFNSYRNGKDIVKISSDHFVAYFALIIWNNELLVVETKDKDWPYDLPGGKKQTKDSSWHVTIVREVFEEIGIILDKKKFKKNFLGTIYDHRSANQDGAPVIASYCYYLLNEEEYNILQMQKVATKGYNIHFVSLEYILKRKQENNQIGSLEWFCHAPEFSIKMLCEKLGIEIHEN